MNLSDKIYARLEELSEAGNDLLDDKNPADAIRKWQSALELLPEPKQDWEAATWLHASIGDAEYQLGNFDAARHSFFDALNAVDGNGNPFVYFRLGQCQVKLGQADDAIDNFLKAYMLDGENIFRSDPHGVACLALLKSRELI
jgi:tetratricopeptide (TPR) repeat protein